MAKARRKMRRALMKKMKKGSLTPGERRDLMELDREVNRANRQAAGIGGAGLAAALAIASKTGALKKGKDALGEFLDERAGIREERKGRKAIEKQEEREAKERAEDEADLSRRASAAARSEKLAADRAAREKEVQRKREEDEFYKDFYKEGEEDMREAERERKEQERSEKASFDPYIEAVRNMDGSVAVGPANKKQDIRKRRQEEMKRAQEERLDKRLERRGGFDPRTGEYVDSAKQRAADEEFDRGFDESLPDAEVMEIARLYNEGRREEAERLASQVLTPEQQQMERFRNRSAVQALRGERSGLPMDASDYSGGFDTSGELPEFSSSSLRRSDGPREEFAIGGIINPTGDPEKEPTTGEKVKQGYADFFSQLSGAPEALMNMAREAADYLRGMDEVEREDARRLRGEYGANPLIDAALQQAFEGDPEKNQRLKDLKFESAARRFNEGAPHPSDPEFSSMLPEAEVVAADESHALPKYNEKGEVRPMGVHPYAIGFGAGTGQSLHGIMKSPIRPRTQPVVPMEPRGIPNQLFYNASGGNTPFLRQMRDRIRKKFR